jgi:hypothetical protein
MATSVSGGKSRVPGENHRPWGILDRIIYIVNHSNVLRMTVVGVKVVVFRIILVTRIVVQFEYYVYLSQ